MSILSREQLTTLVTHEAEACVSIFMRTHRAGRARQQDPIRLKNLLSEAREKLAAHDLDDDQANKLLVPAEAIQDDDEFWTHRQDGLAIFAARDFFREYRVPIVLEASVRVNSRFNIRPLIQLLNGNLRFFVLAISQDSARLFEATRYSIRDLELDAVLATVKQAATNHDEEKTLQFRTHRAVAASKGPALYHGHGRASGVSKQDILKYFQAVDRAVSKVLRGEDAPLVLACVGYLAPIYESTNSYSGLIKGKIPGSPDIWDDDELRDCAWELASPALSRRRNQALERFNRAVGTDKVTDKTRDVVLAASEGRVETLFLEKKRQLWGNVDRNLRAVHVREEKQQGDEELFDFAAAHTLMHSGHVYSLDQDEMPTDESPAAALLRYSA